MNRAPILTEDTAGASTPLVAGSVVPSGVPGYYAISATSLVGAPWLRRDGTLPMTGPLTLFTPGTGAPLTAPLYLPGGALLLTPEAGAIERLVDKLYFTISSGLRKPFVLADASLTSGRIPFTTTDGRLADTANLTRDVATGDITLGDGANLILGGANALGEGCIVFSGAPSNFWDSNVCRVSATNMTMGFVCGTTAGFSGVHGPFFGLRGNTFTTQPNQRGVMFFYGGKPSAPGALEGRVSFGTNDTERMWIAYNGTITLANATVSNLTAGKPVYATTGGALTTTPQGQYLAIATKTANYTLTPTDCVVIGDTSSNNVVLTLPTAAGYQGLIFHLKSSSNLNQLSFATTAGQTVDGSTTGVILYPNSIKVISDNQNWWVI